MTTLSAHAWLLRKLGKTMDLSDMEKACIERLPIINRQAAAGSIVVAQGEHPTESCLVLDGLLCASKTLPDGVLQITSIFVPGDMPDLQSVHLKVLDHAVTALTRCRLACVPHAAIIQLALEQPRVGIALWRETLVYAAIYADWIVNLGARAARERIAHLFCEIHARLQAVGIDEDDFKLSLTQVQLAEASGLSIVHVNRVMQGLRAEGLIAPGRVLKVSDWTRLADVAQFDPAYLHLS